MQIHFFHVAVALMMACLYDNVNAGKFTTAEGSECVWMERKYNETLKDDQVVNDQSAPMIRGFFFFCKCTGEQEEIDYVCEYVGDMKNCPPYRRQSTVFWDQLIKYFSSEFSLFIETHSETSSLSLLVCRTRSRLYRSEN